MTRTASRPIRKRITPYLPLDLAQRLAGHCATARITESSAVEAAVRQYLDGTGDKTFLMHRMDRLGRAQERSHREQELHTEAFTVFIKLWLNYLPSLSQEARSSTALVPSEGRFRRFLELLKQRVSKSERLAHLVAQEPVADAGELAVIAEAASQPRQEGTLEAISPVDDVHSVVTKAGRI